MSWIFLLLAGLFEVVWAVAMKQSHGFTRAVPTLVMVIAMAASFGLLALAMRSLPLGTAYMVWTGIGAVGAFAVGVVFLGEPLGPQRVLAALLVISGIAAMQLSP